MVILIGVGFSEIKYLKLTVKGEGDEPPPSYNCVSWDSSSQGSLFERSRVSGATSVDSDASSVSLEAKPKDEIWLTSKVECRHYQKTKE